MILPTRISYNIPRLNKIMPNKVNWEIDINRSALLIHDMQEYFLNSFNRNSNPFKVLINNIQFLISAVRKAKRPIFYTAQPGNQQANERALLTDFWGKGLSDSIDHIKIIDDLSPQDSDIELIKWRYSAFKKTDLENKLCEQKCDNLIIVGVYGHIGCLATALEAFMLDIKPFIPIDAIADFSYADHVMAVSYIAQRCGMVIETQQLIDKLELMTKTYPSTREELKFLIANYLSIPVSDLADDANLNDYGLDSITLMQLADKWQSLGVTFPKLIQDPTVNGWWKLFVTAEH